MKIKYIAFRTWLSSNTVYWKTQGRQNNYYIMTNLSFNFLDLEFSSTGRSFEYYEISDVNSNAEPTLMALG